MDKDFKSLIVWRESKRLAVSIYFLTETFPPREKFGLVDQMRRAGVSVASNIAEGHDRTTEKEFSRFLDYSSGSLAELETQLLIATDVHFVSEIQLEKLTIQIQAIRNMLRKLKQKLASSDRFEIRESSDSNPYGDDIYLP